MKHMPMKRANDDHGAGALFPNDCKFPGELARILHGDQHGILALPEIAPQLTRAAVWVLPAS